MQLYSYTMQFANRLPLSQRFVARYSESPTVPSKFLNLGGRQNFFSSPKLGTKFRPLTKLRFQFSSVPFVRSVLAFISVLLLLLFIDGKRSWCVVDVTSRVN